MSLRKRKGIAVVVSGFSGTGKGTLMRELMARYDNYSLSVSMTTRAPRKGEEHGRDYFFVTDEEFEELIASGGLLEHAGYCGHYYGTPKAFVEEKLEEGLDVILEIETQGALQIKKRYPEALLLFVMPPSIEELKHRLVGRGTETEEVIRERILQARDEAQGIEYYDSVIINDDLDVCVKELHDVIEAAHLAPFRNMEFIEEIKEQLYRE
ncbi:MAG: guanylate kinase [Butyrivibrio sp.]|nr:guanylate kinase [Butyrivibrio sp.]